MVESDIGFTKCQSYTFLPSEPMLTVPSLASYLAQKPFLSGCS